MSNEKLPPLVVALAASSYDGLAVKMSIKEVHGYSCIGQPQYLGTNWVVFMRNSHASYIAQRRAK